MKLYHYSTFENFPSIQREGLKIGTDNVVYLAESPELAREFAYIYGLKSYALFEVDIEPNEISESTDHNEDYFKKLTGELSAECYSCKHNIPADRVTFLGCYSFSD
ncbi:hypothetical protein AU077_06775 [Streptococcus gallolyticus]|uniref:hypothetical protein n=1 Tax=Streptococcus gallolyticus TaxID=315405 RepID=UPI000733BC05|nr:hypothetical protein [Streptococcus gallolyticus]ALT81237.1 hypothetical protein AU077_06775 [Streptococcus gallolyticus]